MILLISLLGFGLGPALSGWLSEFVVGEERLRTAVAIVIIGGMAITLFMLLIVQGRLRDYTATRERHAAPDIRLVVPADRVVQNAIR